MKTLVLRRNSITDGPHETIGPKGLELAKRQGRFISSRGIVFDKLFYAPFLEMASTALAFCDGLDYTPATQPVRIGLDIQALMAEINLKEFDSAVENGLSNFKAILEVHGEEKVRQWADRARLTVISMFDQMEDGETAIGFLHGIIIVLAAYSCGVKASIPDWDKLGPMEGLIFSFESPTKILVNERAGEKRGLGCS